MRDYNKHPKMFDGSQGSQKHQVAKSFFERPKTCTMVYYNTGVPVKNIDRIKSGMLKLGNLFEVKKDICEITRMPGVIYYSNNEQYYPKDLPTQLKLY